MNSVGQNDQMVKKMKAELDSLRLKMGDRDDSKISVLLSTKATTHMTSSPKQGSCTTQFNLMTTEHNQRSPRAPGNVSLVCPSCKHQFKYNIPLAAA
jgi:hypothetical protein